MKTDQGQYIFWTIFPCPSTLPHQNFSRFRERSLKVSTLINTQDQICPPFPFKAYSKTIRNVHHLRPLLPGIQGSWHLLRIIWPLDYLEQMVNSNFYWKSWGRTGFELRQKAWKGVGLTCNHF